jgi:lipopolysaccharide/colanic/teichoic acid biosynthesis glycosyltransferase
MITESDPYTVNPLDKNDLRITRVGRFLRKTSLDELPQIINILKGEMSFVGPRPEMSFIVETYNDIHKERLKILPGLTGLWQLSGDRERAIHENMDYDLYYIRNQSFFLDVVILIETFLFAFKGI